MQARITKTNRLVYRSLFFKLYTENREEEGPYFRYIHREILLGAAYWSKSSTALCAQSSQALSSGFFSTYASIFYGLIFFFVEGKT
jgi:hypothetical protein